jgi:hypothetical protein
LLFAGSFFAILQNCRVASRMNVKKFPELYRMSRRFYSLRHIFEPYHMMFKELKEKKRQLPIT